MDVSLVYEYSGSYVKRFNCVQKPNGVVAVSEEVPAAEGRTQYSGRPPVKQGN